MTAIGAPRGGRPRRRLLAGLRLAATWRFCMPPARSGSRPWLDGERERRDVNGMPWRHPEYLTRPLRRRYEKRLRALAAATWPQCEYEKDF